jgi:ribosomal protein S18 acetylase RimI-like enzyme
VSAAVEIERRGAAAIDELEALWLVLKNHHGACTPQSPVHDDATSWDMRRRDYAQWLAEDGAFLLIARIEGAAVGYALVRIHGPSPTWIKPDRYAIVQDLAVAEKTRGAGIGRRLLDEVEAQSGCDVIELAVLAANDSARAFYERLGFELYVETLRRTNRQ